MTSGRRKSERSTWRKLCSPQRPPVWQRESLCRFWRCVAAGLSSEDAAVEAGVSGPVGIRWFRSAGGTPPTRLGDMLMLNETNPRVELITGLDGRRYWPAHEKLRLTISGPPARDRLDC